MKVTLTSGGYGDREDRITVHTGIGSLEFQKVDGVVIEEGGSLAPLLLLAHEHYSSILVEPETDGDAA